MKNYMDNLTDLEKIEFLISKLSSEGFDYSFETYSKWKEIKDKEFHKLRKKYLKSKLKLQDRISELRQQYMKDELKIY